MNTSTPQRSKPKFQHAALTSAIALCLSLTPLSPAHALLDIPSSPIQTSSGVASNLMFVLDDSGSMQWEAMPDNVLYSYYAFPVPDNLYGGTGYSKRIVTFEDTSGVNTKFRSPQFNKIFYDPTVSYVPWVKSDGSSFGDANPTLARFNPYDAVSQPSATCTGTISTTNRCIDLTVQQTFNIWTYVLISNNYYQSNSNKTFWPITFYMYKGTGSEFSPNSYIKYQIRGNQGFRQDLNGGIETPVTSFTWPGGIIRTVLEERQNFANWFSYARSRILSVRGGTGLAFKDLNGDRFRVGFTTINTTASAGILQAIGIPTDAVAGTFSGSAKDNFFATLYGHIMPTLGTPLRRSLNSVGTYYEDTSATGPWGPAASGTGQQASCRQSFTVLTTDGYWNGPDQGVGNADGTDGAVITSPSAATYQYTPAPPFSDAFSDTLADVAMKYWKKDLRTDLVNDVPITGDDPAFWQHMTTFTVGLGVSGTLDSDPNSSTYALPGLKTGATAWTNNKIDDLWHASINGHGSYISAKNSVEYAKGLKDTLGAIEKKTGSASNLVANSSSYQIGNKAYATSYQSGAWTGELTAYSMPGLTPTWTASGKIPTPASRNIKTWNGTAGINFTWASLPAAAKAALDYDATTGNANDDWVVQYLRGDQAHEETQGGTLRNRTKLLGDIIHSSPAYNGETDTVFVGANDGMLHAFNGTTGVEQFAYIPGQLLTTGLKTLSDPNYVHRYFVDGQIVVSTKSQTPGKSRLVATMGAGAKGLFGLDVTDPSTFTNSNVTWEYTPDADMGFILGKLFIAKLNNGKWGVITGNGYNSTSQQSALYVFDLETGALIKSIPTNKGSATESNGLTTPKGVDADKNGTLDYVYAGDLLGNMWKFDLTSAAVASWEIANGVPMFVAKDASNKRQPITGGVAIATNPYPGPNKGKRYIMFGTGQYFNSTDAISKDVQSWYGLIDDSTATILRSELATRTIDPVVTRTVNGAPLTLRSFSKATAGDMVGKKGWFVDLKVAGAPADGERIVSDSSIDVGASLTGAPMPVLRASSIVLGNYDPCKPSATSFYNVIDPFTGGSLAASYIDINQDGVRDSQDLIDPTNPNSSPIGSVGIDGAIGEGLDMGNNILLPTGTGGVPAALQAFKNNLSGRQTWHEIKN